MQEAVEAMHCLIERHKISRRCRQGSHPLVGKSCPEARALIGPRNETFRTANYSDKCLFAKEEM